jgi:hypothetical protein
MIAALGANAVGQTDKPAGSAPPMPASASPAKPKQKPLRVALSTTPDGPATTAFKSDAPKICAMWKGTALKMGDRLRAVWVAEGIGSDSRQDRLITEGATRAYKPDDDGIFSLARPREGWPNGKYRFELYVNNELADKVHFSIEPGVAIEVH